MLIEIPVPTGELFDKITILELKVRHLRDAARKANAQKELDLLRDRAAPLDGAAVAATVARLAEVNAALWDVEDELRIHEDKADFGPTFVDLARSVYRLNDERAALKRTIGVTLGSPILEEKSYGQ
jgi:hypothetical protein